MASKRNVLLIKYSDFELTQDIESIDSLLIGSDCKTLFIQDFYIKTKQFESNLFFSNMGLACIKDHRIILIQDLQEDFDLYLDSNSLDSSEDIHIEHKNAVLGVLSGDHALLELWRNYES